MEPLTMTPGMEAQIRTLVRASAAMSETNGTRVNMLLHEIDALRAALEDAKACAADGVIKSENLRSRLAEVKKGLSDREAWLHLHEEAESEVRDEFNSLRTRIAEVERERDEALQLLKDADTIIIPDAYAKLAAAQADNARLGVLLQGLVWKCHVADCNADLGDVDFGDEWNELARCEVCDGHGTKDKLPHEDEEIAPDNVCPACSGMVILPRLCTAPSSSLRAHDDEVIERCAQVSVKHGELPADFTDIGDGHAVCVSEDESGQVRGVWVRHECSIRDHHGKHGAYIPLSGSNPWTLVKLDPLTITPSIHVIDCGDHGFITNGRWVRV